MNHLAHALLAGTEPEVMLGSLMGDFVRGAIDPALPPELRRGIALHRAIDRWTDAHPEVTVARSRFEPPFRRYAGILIDIHFDHLLACEWAGYGTGSLHDFSQRVQALLRTNMGRLPMRMQDFARYLLANDLPERYRDPAMIETVFSGVSRRLARPNPLAEGARELLRLREPLATHFAAFLPQLADFAATGRARLSVPST